MRTILLVLTIIAVGGCAGTRDSQRTGQDLGSSSHSTPLVQEQPSLSDRLRYSRQRKAEQAGMAMTEVQGNIKER